MWSTWNNASTQGAFSIWHLNPRGWHLALCPGACVAQLCQPLVNPTLFPGWNPYIAALTMARWESMPSRGQAQTSPLFHPRMKLSFASEPNPISSVGSNYTREEDPCWGVIREGLWQNYPHFPGTLNWAVRGVSICKRNILLSLSNNSFGGTAGICELV